MTRLGDLDNVADRKRLREISPVFYADRINAPVLVAYGKNDMQVRSDQGFGMEAALKKEGKTFEMIVEKKEGHGFRKEKLSIAFYTRVDAFLKKYVMSPRGSVQVGEAKVIKSPVKAKE
jgi:dipeptidyl aminopeptidase/acylaminoacyl peptidase